MVKYMNGNQHQTGEINICLIIIKERLSKVERVEKSNPAYDR